MWIMYLIMAAIILVACLSMKWGIALIFILILINALIIRGAALLKRKP